MGGCLSSRVILSGQRTLLPSHRRCNLRLTIGTICQSGWPIWQRASKWDIAFDPTQCASPLPRAYDWLDGSAYVNHVALVRKARGAEVPQSFWTDPLMYQGGSDVFLGPRDPILMANESWGIDLEAEVVVVLGDLPMGVTRDEALRAIRLIMLVNDLTLRNVTAPAGAKLRH
jgi:2-keto-4-pentenoate hydratase/2-oxohepta-3-ene-1,7-dioic acid hydratase in catechol pathway